MRRRAMLAAAVLAGCVGKGTADAPAGLQEVVVPQQGAAPRLCLSPVPAAGRLRGGAPQAWADAAQLIAEQNLVGAQVRLSEAPDHPGADALRGAVQLLSGDLDAARATYRTLANDWPTDGCLQITAAAIYMAEREPVVARTHATDAWRLRPDDPNAQYVYALAWLDAGDDSRASSALRKIVAADPSHPGAGFLLGTDYLQRGQVEQAIPLLEAARGGGIDVTEALAGAYFSTGQLGPYIALASGAGWPLGDDGAIASASDPMAAWRAHLGVGDGQQLWADIETSLGDMRCALFWDEAPVTVGNFVGLARGGLPWTDPQTLEPTTRPLYPGATFHRVIPGFMIQGGDPIGTGNGSPGYRFRDEIRPERLFDVPGVLAMANSGPDSNGSQFFITDAPTAHLNGNHTIFGQCDPPSLDTVRKIARTPTNANQKPLEEVTILAIRISAAP